MSELGTTVDYWALMLNYRLFVPKTFRSQERKVPMENFRSPGTKVPGNFRSPELSFPGTFVPGERKFNGTFVPGPFRSQQLSFLGTFVPGPFISFPYLCALVYNSSFGCSNSVWRRVIIRLHVGRPNVSVSLSTGIVTFIHFALLLNSKKQHDHTLSLFSLFLLKKPTVLGLRWNKFWQLL